MIKKIIVIVVVFLTLNGFSQQKSINNYKYIIVPNKFDFLKTADQYQVNSLTKFLFNKYGFTTFLDNETFPEDLASNRCLALKAIVVNESGMFSTINHIELKDCNSNVVFKTPKGKSKIKDYKKSYHEAIRKAFNAIQALNYSYKAKDTEVFMDNVDLSIKEDEKSIENKKNPVVKQSKTVTYVKNTLYAQAIKNGFQVVDSEPKIIFRLLKSSKKGLFFIENKNGILYKTGNDWIAEYYENEVLIKRKYSIKF